MSHIHPASLVDASTHSKKLLQMLELEVNRNMMDYLILATKETVAFALGTPSQSHNRHGRPIMRPNNDSSGFSTFVSNVVTRSEVSMRVLLVALVYINRAQPYLLIEIEKWACERVFLGALMLAAKYTSDSTLQNKHWSLVTGVFGRRDVGRLEREFLDVLAWKLAITESDILEHYEPVMSWCRQRHPRCHSPSPASTRTSKSNHLSEDSHGAWFDSDSDSDCSSPCSPPPPRTPIFSEPTQPMIEFPPSVNFRSGTNTHPSLSQTFRLPSPWHPHKPQHVAEPSSFVIFSPLPISTQR